MKKAKDPKREIIGLALLLEDVSDLAVFVSYSGHVQKVGVRVYENHGQKEEKEEKELLYSEFYADLRYRTEKEYLKIKKFLETKVHEYTVIS